MMSLFASGWLLLTISGRVKTWSQATFLSARGFVSEILDREDFFLEGSLVYFLKSLQFFLNVSVPMSVFPWLLLLPKLPLAQGRPWLYQWSENICSKKCWK